MRREFLGWKDPFLPALVRWLEAAYRDGETLDLSGVVVALPGRRAGRRLLELLAETNGIVSPPRFVTAGNLPEALYEDETPAAEPALSRLAWVRSLQDLDADERAAVFGLAPDPNDTAGWADLADQVASLHETLSADHLDFDAVRKRRTIAGYDDSARWNVLAKVGSRYQALLREHGARDLHERRFAAWKDQRCRPAVSLVVAGMPDLNTVSARMLAQAAETTAVTVLVQAPESERASFDEFGRPLPAAWRTRTLPVTDAQIVVADQPRDQATEVLRLLAAEPDRTADAITIGACDETLVPAIERGLDLAGVPSRTAAGRPLVDTGPVRLLSSLAAWLASESFHDLSTLLRAPDLAPYLIRALDLPEEASSRWTEALDVHAARHIPTRTPTRWPDDKSELMPRILDTLRALTRPLAGTATIPRWTHEIVRVLETVYERNPAATGRLAGVFEELERALAPLCRLPETGSLAVVLPFPDAVTWVLDAVSSRAIPPPGGDAAVEILGWLELALDDAERVIVTGFNEANIPGGAVHDPFLPDAARTELGLPDAARRYARDAFLLTALLSSARTVSLVAGRRRAEGDPLTPSRLLLACPDADLSARIRTLYAELPEPTTAWRFLPPGGLPPMVLPPPQPPARPIEKMSVTDFAKFLECPYTYYLGRVVGLETIEPEPDELDALLMGNAFHAVLRRFGEAERSAPTEDEHAIRRFLLAALDDVFREEFGTRLPAALRIQKTMMAERLAAFAAWQARETRAGWRIVEVETKHLVPLEVDGVPMGISGQIDRIDRREEGRRTLFRVIDYKSSAAKTEPDKLHRKGREGAKRWVGLQLPLYRLMLLAQLAGKNLHADEIQLGFVSLCQDLGSIGFYAADWTEAELEEAIELARVIIRDVRANRFWPPLAKPVFPPVVDFVGSIRMDHALDRETLILALEKAHGLERSRAVTG